MQQAVPTDSGLVFCPDLPLSSCSLVDGMGMNRAALGFAAGTFPSAMGNAPDLEMGDLETSPNSPFTSCVPGADPLASLSLLPA